MRLLSIHRGQLELARVPIHRPVATIGRSPSCDIVLRAPEVRPIQFVMEWVGPGEFDPRKGFWSIFDISKSEDESGEGVALTSSDPVSFGGFSFRWVEDRLEATTEIGGVIREQMDTVAGTDSSQRLLLEVVQFRSDSGSIEEVRHLIKRTPGKARQLLPRVKELKIEWSKDADLALRILHEEMPGAEILRKGSRVLPEKSLRLLPNDLLSIRWRGTQFFLRFVPAIRTPRIRRTLFRDPLLFKLSLAGLGLGAFLLILNQMPRPEPPPVPPPRIAKIEIKEVAPPPPPPPVVTPPKELPKEASAGFKLPTPKKSAPAKASAPRVVTDPGKKAIGLNSPAEVKNVNQMGLLGALSKAPAKGPGVKADMIINQGLVTQSVANSDTSAIVIKNPPAGVLGTGNHGGGSGKSNLSGASTSLRGASGYDPTAAGPIAREGGTSGYSIGTALSGNGSGLGSGKELGTLDRDNQMDVSGGLDRETVRRVIASYRSQIRICYERGLLTNPKLSGRILYKWTISAAGHVVRADIQRSDAHSPVLEGCVLQVIRSMRFPSAPTAQTTGVIYPFVFQPR